MNQVGSRNLRELECLITGEHSMLIYVSMKFRSDGTVLMPRTEYKPCQTARRPVEDLGYVEA